MPILHIQIKLVTVHSSFVAKLSETTLDDIALFFLGAASVQGNCKEMYRNFPGNSSGHLIFRYILCNRTSSYHFLFSLSPLLPSTQLVIVGVWITSAIYSLPKFIYVHTVTMSNSVTTETMCVPNRQIYNSAVFDMINFGFLYVTPLLVMTVSTSRD